MAPCRRIGKGLVGLSAVGPHRREPGGSLEDVEQLFGAENPNSLGLGGGSDDALILQLADSPHDGVVGDAELLFGTARRQRTDIGEFSVSAG